MIEVFWGQIDSTISALLQTSIVLEQNSTTLTAYKLTSVPFHNKPLLLSHNPELKQGMFNGVILSFYYLP